MTSSLTNSDNLKRLLYLSNPQPKYVCGDPDVYTLPSLKHETDLLDHYALNASEFAQVVTEVASDIFLPHRSTIFHVAALIQNHPQISNDGKANINEAVLKICENDRDFFHYISYTTKFRNAHTKLSKSVRKIAHKYYTAKSPEDLVRSYVEYISNQSWSHKKLIKLIHYKSESPIKNLIVNHILGIPPKTENISDDDSKKLLQTMIDIDCVRTSKDANDVLGLIVDLKIGHKQLTPFHHKSTEAWEAVLPQMTIQEILHSLPKFYKLGLLRQKTLVAAIVDCLTDVEKVKASQILPIEVFIYLKNFEKGGRPMDIQLFQYLVKQKKLSAEEQDKLKEPNEPKCLLISGALHKCMSLAYNSVQSTNKRFLITIDTSEKMDLPCLYNRNVTCLEAALSIAMCYLKAEKDVTIAVYHERIVKVFQLEKNGHFASNLQKLREQKCAYIMPMAPMEWAQHKKKHFDVFINFVHYFEPALIPKDIPDRFKAFEHTITKYQESINPDVKVIIICLAFKRLAIPIHRNFIDIVGLDTGVPKVLQAFLTGKFN